MDMRQCWSHLAAAVIEAAVDDRRKAASELKENPYDTDAAYVMDETWRFFMSDWFETLLAMSGADVSAEEVRNAVR